MHPVDPFYLSWKARQSGFEARFIELAGAVNGAMPHYVVSLVADALNAIRLPLSISRVLIAGVACKRNVDDIRESPALDLLTLLKDAEPRCHARTRTSRSYRAARGTTAPIWNTWIFLARA